MTPIDPRFRDRWVSVRRAEGRRRLRLVVAALCGLVLLVGGWGATRSPLLDLDHVRVEGAQHTPGLAVLAAGNLLPGRALVDIDDDVARRRIERLPWVASARVRHDWGGTVVVTVREREAVAAVPGGAGGFALVDRGGRVLEAVAEPPGGLPVLLDVPAAGAPATSLEGVALGSLDVAAVLPRDLRARVASVVRTDTGEVELRLQPEGVVRLGPPAQVEPKLVAATTVLTQIETQGLAVLDVRVPASPVLTRQAPPG